MAFIELAPHHKTGLPLSNPVMPAAGVFGYGDAYHDLVDFAHLGALVTNPVSLYPRRAAHGPRVATHNDHILIHTGLPNPGLKRIIHRHRKVWARLPLPIIVHLIATTPPQIADACQMLSNVPGVAGIELGLDDSTAQTEALTLLTAAQSTSELPLIARLPFHSVETLALPLAEANVDALTLTAPPRACLPTPPTNHEEETKPSHCGRLYGRGLYPLLLATLKRWAAQIPVPIIACGGIATPEEAQACLDLGATALQIDALLWRNPGMLMHIADGIAHNLESVR